MLSRVCSPSFRTAQYANAGGKIIVSEGLSLKTSESILQLRELQAKPELVDQLSQTLTKSGGLPGISKRGFTKKDFMDHSWRTPARRNLSTETLT